MQTDPVGLHVPQSSPQICSDSATQAPSHCCWQQNGSFMHTAFTHAPHWGPSGGPATHSSCGHGGGAPQTPALHWPLQHCAGELQPVPFG